MSRFSGTYAAYAHEMTDADHVALAETLHGLSGMVVVSGYPSDLYDALYGDWKRIEIEVQAASQHASQQRTECLWLNPSAVAALAAQEAGVSPSLFDAPAEVLR